MSGRRPAAAARAAAPQLSIRRPLVRPPDARGVIRLVRGLPRRVLVLGGGLVLLCMVRVWLQLQTVDVGYELSAARQMQLRLEHERRELELEIATLRDPARLADVAHRRLGLIEPRKGQVVVLP